MRHPVYVSDRSKAKAMTYGEETAHGFADLGQVVVFDSRSHELTFFLAL